MTNYSRCIPDATDTLHSLVKFLLPLDRDALALPAALGLIDTVCYRGSLAHEVVAVDDASGDATATEARRFAHFMPLWLIQHRKPMGRSAAFRTAVEAACRDTSDDDLLVPIDARCRPDPRVLLHAIRAARQGWSAVTSDSGRESWGERPERVPGQVAVYRAGLVKRHLCRFLDSASAPDSAALQQLESYLCSAGVAFHRLPAPLPRRSLLRPLAGSAGTVLRLGTGGR